MMLRRSAVLLSVVGSVVVLVVAACGGGASHSSSHGVTATTRTYSPTVGKTRTSTRIKGIGARGPAVKSQFVLHAGLAFGAFHHWIYRPFRAGLLTRPRAHRTAISLSALAAMFTYHELELAALDVRTRGAVYTLFAPLSFLVNSLRGLYAELRRGHASRAEISAVTTGIAGISSDASGLGQRITDEVPTAKQLARGVIQ